MVFFFFYLFHCTFETFFIVSNYKKCFNNCKFRRITNFYIHELKHEDYFIFFFPSHLSKNIEELDEYTMNSLCVTANSQNCF